MIAITVRTEKFCKEDEMLENTNVLPRELFTVDGNTLMAQEFEPLQFSVDKILPHGLFILAGSPKVGKSWLALDLCRAAATGSELWNYSAEQGDVLYLALEDTFNRLQNRLKKVGVDNDGISKLHLATTSHGIHDGLLAQINHFVAKHPETNLVVIDTLEHIRNGAADKSMYSYDYNDMCRLREITDKHKLTLLLVHHTRKASDPDPLNTISGSTGLVGAVDGVFVLDKIKRIDNAATLTIANRDTKNFCFNLKFDTETCRWLFMGNYSDDESDEEFLTNLVDDFLTDNWSGTATELSLGLKNLDNSFDLNPATLTKQLKSQIDVFRQDCEIEITFERKRDSRQIILQRMESVTV